MKKNSTALTFILLTCMLLFWINAAADAGQQTVNIGFVGDFSAVSKAYTENMYKAAQMAVEDFNAAGGVIGNRIRLIKKDAGNAPEKHYQCVTSLVRDNNVVAVFGGASSPCVLKASAACKKLKVPYLVSIGNSSTITIENGHPYVFMFQPNLWMETKAFSIFVTLMPWQRYAWVGPDYSWGHNVLKSFKQHFEEIGASIEWTTEAWHRVGTTDYKAIVRQILKGKPDALVIGSYGEDVRHFTLQAKSSGLFDKVAVFGWFTYNMTGDMGRIVPEGMWNLARGGPFNYLAAKFPQTKRFVDNLVKKFYIYPNDYTICCYDSILAWRQAVEKTPSTAPEVVANALKGLKFNGLRGDSYIRPVDGQMNCPTYFGRLVFVDQYPFAIWKSVIEIPAAKTWLSEKEVLARRAKSR